MKVLVVCLFLRILKADMVNIVNEYRSSGCVNLQRSVESTQPSCYPTPCRDYGRNTEGSYEVLCADTVPPTPDPTVKTTPAPGKTTPAPDGSNNNNGGVGGEPHFNMWSGERYSYHGECDLILMSSSDFGFGSGLTIYIRTEIRNHYSFIKGVALKYGNDKIEMDRKNWWFNGQLYESPLPEFAGNPVRKIESAKWCQERCSKATIHQIDFGVHGNVELANWAGYLHVTVTEGQFEQATGLLGSLGTSDWMGRNGTVFQDVDQFGQEWQVRDTDPILFHEQRPPIYPDPCVLPNISQRRMSNASATSMAEKACARLSPPLYAMCMFDVEATGDEMMAYAPMFG